MGRAPFTTMHGFTNAALLLSSLWTISTEALNSTFYNPILPGWNSDPTCTQVNGTFFCATSTFDAFPGLPIYASNDLINWKLVSHAWNREEQLPGIGERTLAQQAGMYAPTLRYHDGEFYIICTYLYNRVNGSVGTLFKTSDPFDNAAWSQPVLFDAPSIDPDLFWDDDGKLYMAYAGIGLAELNAQTGELTEGVSIWNGTGGVFPEGPHIYKKNDWYYLLIAEGGTELNHMVTIARSRNITGPYEGYENNPILSNANTTEYFQTVGHADLFQDQSGKWWGSGLATRSGPEWEIYPMGRETVLYAASWDGDWPVLDPVRGVMHGWPLPSPSQALPAIGPYTWEPETLNFAPGSSLPAGFYTWRYPPSDSTFQISPAGHENTLRILPSRANLTGSSESPELSGLQGIAFVSRKQEHSLFTFAVDLNFNPQRPGQEAGITAFLTQQQHLDLSVRHSNSSSRHENRQIVLRTYADSANLTSSLNTIPLPSSWSKSNAIRLQIHTANDSSYVFSAWPVDNANERLIVGSVSARILSGGTGPFTGTLLGAFATCNGGNGRNNTCADAGGEAYFSNWSYTGAAQKIAASEFVPSAALHGVI
ncbi:hypothetical protein CKM354_000919700 [Cercospora kikuchii]|uniref:Beta-xylosidase C-terminal Concanavalin A-like domain-containing protein n=1 Tax=Cercospora kikuchii TaxID=84275 RepID=A0A9P3CR61_9PEZI|nr:uncharacterized protein CKM354_000919700 [Cercospora kikuchii]GIZ46057.1 hypothetical protein CKM354_000919700 [Cercospora kikuchii]